MLAGRLGVGLGTHLFLLLVEVVNDDTNEEVEGEEGPKDDEDDEVEVHVQVHLILRLFLLLRGTGWGKLGMRWCLSALRQDPDTPTPGRWGGVGHVAGSL